MKITTTMIKAIQLNESKTYVLEDYKTACSAASLASHVTKSNDAIRYVAKRRDTEVTITAILKGARQ